MTWLEVVWLVAAGLWLRWAAEILAVPGDVAPPEPEPDEAATAAAGAMVAGTQLASRTRTLPAAPHRR